MEALRPLGGAVAAAGTLPGHGSGIKAASGPGGALGGGHVIIQYGGGVGHPRPNPARSQREKGDQCVFICQSARPNQNTTWPKTVSPLKFVLTWWAGSGAAENIDGLNIPCSRPSPEKPTHTHLCIPLLLA